MKGSGMAAGSVASLQQVLDALQAPLSEEQLWALADAVAHRMRETYGGQRLSRAAAFPHQTGPLRPHLFFILVVFVVALSSASSLPCTEVGFPPIDAACPTALVLSTESVGC
jgi:hypothetical protein